MFGPTRSNRRPSLVQQPAESQVVTTVGGRDCGTAGRGLSTGTGMVAEDGQRGAPASDGTATGGCASRPGAGAAGASSRLARQARAAASRSRRRSGSTLTPLAGASTAPERGRPADAGAAADVAVAAPSAPSRACSAASASRQAGDSSGSAIVSAAAAWPASATVRAISTRSIEIGASGRRYVQDGLRKASGSQVRAVV